MLDVQIDQRAIDQLILQFGSTAKQVRLARSSALRKMRKRVETAVKRLAAKELRMPQKTLGKRFYSDPVKTGDDTMKLWIGTQTVSPFDLGTVNLYGVPGKTGGIKAGRRSFRGAFLASIYTAKQKVWIRMSSKFFSPELYPTKKRSGDRGLGDLKGRFPVIRAAVPIDEILERVVDQYGPEMAADFEKILVQELNYYTNVRGKA